MKRLTHAPNIAIAQLWADMLNQQGFAVTVQRYFLGGIAGDLPPDQCWPELWVTDDAQLGPARAALAQLQNQVGASWVCSACGEWIEGSFGQCWNCGAAAPALSPTGPPAVG
jgi:hypothetical protein